MKKRLLYICSLLLLLCSSIKAQNVVVNAEIDSVQRLIGEQARIKLKVTCDADRRLQMPLFSQNIIDGIEIVEVHKDTQCINDGKRLSLTYEYVVTSFDTALYVIPPFEVLVDSVPYYSEELAMDVSTYIIEEANEEQFFGPKDIWHINLAWEDVQSSVVFFILLALCGTLLAWVAVRYINNKPIIRIVKVTPKLPAHVIALKEIERIRGDKVWRLSAESKEFYTVLTDALRVYINDRFGVNATEMTTSEIVDSMLKFKDKESLRSLQELLTTADLVKFAKLNTPVNEKDAHLESAVDFVNATKEANVDENPKPVEKRVVNKRSAKEKMALFVAMILLSVAVVALLVLLIQDIYYLLN